MPEPDPILPINCDVQSLVEHLRETLLTPYGREMLDEFEPTRPLETGNRVISEGQTYVAAELNSYPRRGGACNHRRCQGSDEGCRAYVEEVLAPNAADDEYGRQLVAENWWSTSHKYGHISRWKELVPGPEQIEAALIAIAGEYHGRRLAEVLRRHEHDHYDCRALQCDAKYAHQEHRTITPAQMKAFKRAGGDCGR